MKCISSLLIAGSLFLLVPGEGQAITVSKKKAITEAGQSFKFKFKDLPEADGGGIFSVTLNGDYSGFAKESAFVKLVGEPGRLDLGAGTDGVLKNKIAGLTLASFTESAPPKTSNDRKLTWLFDITAALLGSLLSDNKVVVKVDNDPGVDAYEFSKPNFVKVGLQYTEAAVPLPAAAPLLATAFAALGFVGWRRSKTG